MPRRLALLVATYRYEDAGLRQLAAPGHDAEALAEVLRDPAIADFDVTVLVNEPHHVVGEAIGEFYHNRRRDDLTLLYFTGHGLKDDDGRLYLAMTNTKRDRLLFTGLSALQIDEAMESCASRQKVLVLDCCYSGAFPASRTSKSDGQVHTLEKFRGKGRVVLTASDATQYSFEGDHILGQGTQSVFTRFLVEGLITGEADLDRDGDISLDELYGYVYDRVTEEMPQQRPKKQENVEGRIVIARNVHWSLPSHVRNAIESPFAPERLAVLEGLAHLHRVGNDLVRAQVMSETRRLIDDDSRAVSTAAMNLMTTLNPEQARSRADGVSQEAGVRARQAAEVQGRQAAQVRQAAEVRQAEVQARQAADAQARQAAQVRQAVEVRQAEVQTRHAADAQARQAAQVRQAAEAADAQARRVEAQVRQEAQEPSWVPAVTSTPPHRRVRRREESQVTSLPQPPLATDSSMWPLRSTQPQWETEGRPGPLKERVSRLLLRHVPTQGWSKYARFAYYISLGMLLVWATAAIADQKSWTDPTTIIASVFAYLVLAVLPAWLLGRLTIRLARGTLDRSVESQEPPQ